MPIRQQRSRFLHWDPGPNPPRKNMGVRWLLFLAAAFLGLFICIGAGGRRFAPNGWAHFLYVIHDRIFLPMKGWLWNKPFPHGTVYLGVPGFFLWGWLAGQLRGRSLFQPAQILLTRKLLYFSMARHWLIKIRASKVSALFGWTQLEKIVESERRLTLDSLLKEEPESPGSSAWAAAMCLMAEDLAALDIARGQSPHEITRRFESAQRLLETWIAATLCAPKPETQKCGSICVDMNLLLKSLGREATSTTLNNKKSPFAAEAVFENLQDLAHWDFEQPSPEALAPHLAAVGERRSLLDDFRAFSETRALGVGRTFPQPTSLPSGDERAGRLAWLHCLAVSVLAERSEIALGYLESLEGAAFAAELPPSELPSTSPASATPSSVGSALGKQSRGVEVRSFVANLASSSIGDWDYLLCERATARFGTASTRGLEDLCDNGAAEFFNAGDQWFLESEELWLKLAAGREIKEAARKESTDAL